MKKTVLSVAIVVLAACETTPIKFGPEPTGSSGVVSTGATMGAGGDGPGLLCDPCENKDGTRLVRRQQVATSPDGLRSVYPTATLWDTQRDEACAPSVDKTGTTRCFPAAGSVLLPYFQDPACTTRVLAFGSSTCGGTLPTQAIITMLSGDGCTQKTFTEVYTVGPAFVGQLYVGSTANCVVGIMQSGYEYRQLGAKIPDTAFAEMSVQDMK